MSQKTVQYSIIRRKMPKYNKYLLKLRLLSALKVEKVVDKKARFEEKYIWGKVGIQCKRRRKVGVYLQKKKTLLRCLKCHVNSIFVYNLRYYNGQKGDMQNLYMQNHDTMMPKISCYVTYVYQNHLNMIPEIQC